MVQEVAERAYAKLHKRPFLIGFQSREMLFNGILGIHLSSILVARQPRCEAGRARGTLRAMKKKRTGFYHALVTLPDRLYPFKTNVQGQWVRGIRSYNATLARYERAHGVGHYGFKLNTYRQFFHLAGSLLYLLIAAYLTRMFFGSSTALFAFLVAAMLLVSFQEFYLHRRMYQQLWRKGVIDWLAWCAPMGIYLLNHLH